MAITTRRADPADAALLHDLAARTFGLACPPGTRQSDIDHFIGLNLSLDGFERYLADAHRRVLIVESDGEPAGYAMLVGGPIADRDVAALVDETVSVELSKFYVLAERHGSGAATALMTATLAAAAETGAAFCWLGVNQQNVRAARFYSKQGFDVVGARRFRLGDVWHDDHVRLRPLV